MLNRIIHTEPIKIIIVDDSIMYRRVMKEFLENELSCNIIGEATNGREFLELDCIQNVDVVLMDIHMPILTGLDAIKQLLFTYPKTKVIAVTMYNDKIYMSQLIELGFKACVLKTTFFDDIIPAFEKVLNGEMYFKDDIAI